LHQAEARPRPRLADTTAKNTLAAITDPSLLHEGVARYYRDAS